MSQINPFPIRMLPTLQWAGITCESMAKPPFKNMHIPDEWAESPLEFAKTLKDSAKMITWGKLLKGFGLSNKL